MLHDCVLKRWIHMPHRLYVPCGKIGCSRHIGLCGKIGCSRHIGLCGKTTAGLDTDLVVDSLSFLLASELCSMTPTPSRLQTAIPATQARRPGLRTAIGCAPVLRMAITPLAGATRRSPVPYGAAAMVKD